MSRYHNSLAGRTSKDGISSCYQEHQWYEARRRYQAERAKDRAVGYLLPVGAVILAVMCVSVANVLGLIP